MLNVDGNENGQKQKENNKQKQKPAGVIGKKKTKKQNIFACVALLLVHFLAVVVATWNFRVTRFMEKMSYVHTKNFVACVPARFFSLPLIFALLSARSSYFIPAVYHVVLPKKFVSFAFFFNLSSSSLSVFSSRSAPLACHLLSCFLFLYLPNLWTWQLKQFLLSILSL